MAWSEPRPVPRPRSTWWATAACWMLLAAALAIGCGNPVAPPQGPAPGPPAGAGPGGRQQRLALSPKQEYAVGIRAYREVMQEYQGRILPSSNPTVQRVRDIMDRIVQAVEIEPLQREINLRIRGYRFAWEANVIKDNKVNAFCLPAGKVFVFTGILPVARNDDQLATVMSHEIAHALAHHASERIAREQREGGGILSALGNLRHSRAQESEADHIGVFLMTFAGYDPHQAVAFWQRMTRAAGDQHPPEFLSDHPSDEHRIEAMRQWVPKAIAGKKAYDEGRIAPAPR
jgi:metalloendopeptidase OMA1, mitochondrial